MVVPPVVPPVVPDVLDLSMVEGGYFKTRSEELAPRLVTEALTAIDKELRARSKRPEEAAKFLPTILKQYGLEPEFRSMAEARDRFSLASDPALQRFREAYGTPAQEMLRPKPDFAGLFFATTGVFEPQRWTSTLESARSNAFWTYLYWRAEDLKAHEPPNLAAVRDQVEAAWRMLEAQKEARDRANAIRQALEKMPRDKRITSPDELKRWLRDQKANRNSDLKLDAVNPDDVFDLNDITRLVDSAAQPQPLANRPKAVQPYKPPETRIAHPRKNFADQLLRLENRGDVLVISDLPERHFYVAVLRDRRAPTLEEFAAIYASSGTAFGDPIWREALMDDYREHYWRRFMVQMRVDAGAKVDGDGRLVLPPLEEGEGRRQGPIED
jgi:hypothetical protein